MFQTVLVAIDGSDPADRASALVAAMLGPCGVEEVHLATVVAHRPSELTLSAEAYEQVEHAYLATMDFEMSVGRQILDTHESRMRASGTAKTTVHVLTGDPASGIVGLVVALRPDLVVMGRRGLGGVGGLILGSVTRKVQHAVDVPVLTVV